MVHTFLNVRIDLQNSSIVKFLGKKLFAVKFLKIIGQLIKNSLNYPKTDGFDSKFLFARQYTSKKKTSNLEYYRVPSHNHSYTIKHKTVC